MTTLQPSKRVVFWSSLRDFLVYGVVQVRVLRKAYAGIMHTLIFWGMTIQVVGTIIILLQMQLFLPFIEIGEVFPLNTAYLGFEAIMDGAGVALMLGVLMAAFRRVVLRPDRLETQWDDIYALFMLFLIPILGFTTEGLRLVAANPPWAAWSFAGNIVAGWLIALGIGPENAASLHGAFYWVHMGVSVLFVASIPFTKLRHLITAPLFIILHNRQPVRALSPIENIEEVELLGVTEIGEFTPQQLLSFDACVRCGRCLENCPVHISGMPFAPRDFIQMLRGEARDIFITPNGKSGVLTEDLGEHLVWFCTTCGSCIDSCPVLINPISEIIDMRRSQVLMTGKVPGSVGLALRNLERQGNPWGMPIAERTTWLEGLNVPILQPGQAVDVLLYVGCAIAYDDRSKKAGQDLISLLNAAGVDYAVLGEAEACCGETARKLGNEYTFQVFAQDNIALWSEYNFKRIVTPCAHCFNTLKHEYPQFGGNFTVQHYTELLVEMMPKLDFAGKNDLGQVAYQDSCYLGRYNDLYKQPRQILEQAGIDRVEMSRHQKDAFCCGGGGGQMWLETDAETRINQVRLQDADKAQADVIATACPYCLLMFDDAIRSTDAFDRIQVMDISEILAQQLKKVCIQS